MTKVCRIKKREKK